METVVIIGGGVAGLAAGIEARLSGMEAIILEKHTRAGGNLTGWNRRGYHIDNCIHWLTGTNPLTKQYKVWIRLGALGNVGVYQPESLFTFDLDGQQITLWQDFSRFSAELLKKAPEDEKEIRALLCAVRGLMNLDGISGTDPSASCSFAEAVKNVPSVFPYLNLTTGELADRFTNPVLRGMIGSLLGRHFGAVAFLLVISTFCSGNGGIPAGSSVAMAKRMTDRFRSLGGRLMTGCGVERISIRDGHADGVLLENGQSVAADHVIIATDPAAAFGHLLDRKFMPTALSRQYAKDAGKRFSAAQCCFACDVSDVPFRGDFIFPVPKTFREDIMADHLILREFSHEPSFSPDGKSIIGAMVYCDERRAAAWLALSEDKMRYKKQKEQFAEAVRCLITEKFPELAGKITCLDVWTPATYRRFVSSEIGSFMAFILPKRKIPRPLSCRIPGLDNVFLGTQWLKSPGGLPIAANMGIAAVRAIRSKRKQPFAN